MSTIGERMADWDPTPAATPEEADRIQAENEARIAADLNEADDDFTSSP